MDKDNPEKIIRFELTSGQIGNNPVWLFNNKPVSLEIYEDLQKIQDLLFNLVEAARLWKEEWAPEEGKGIFPYLPGEKSLWDAIDNFENLNSK